MVRNMAAVALVACGLLVTAACGNSTTADASPSTAGSTPSSGSTPTAGSTTSAPAASACGSATPVAGNNLNLTYSDNGKDLCVNLGTTLDVMLQGTTADKWMSLHSSSELILASKLGSGSTLPVGSTGADFEAIRPGTAYVSASRYPCGTASPGRHSMQCGVIIGYRVNITVAS